MTNSGLYCALVKSPMPKKRLFQHFAQTSKSIGVSFIVCDDVSGR